MPAIPIFAGAPGTPLAQAWLATTEALAGSDSRAHLVAERLALESRTAFVEPVAIAWLHYTLGDFDAALAELEHGFALHSPLMPALLQAGAYLWRGIAGDPRYGALIARIGLPSG